MAKDDNLVTRPTMVKHIRERLKSEYGLEATREVTNAILDILDDEVYAIVAQNQRYKFLWGTISGVSKPPVKVSGKFSELKTVKENFGYSTWKNGFPNIKWSSIMKIYDVRTPEEYFEQPNVRYTTAAREFRKDAKLPEIPEYENLPEEKILEYCARADKLNFKKMNARERRNKARDDKFNGLKLKALHEYWRQTNYTPMGTTNKDWTGKTLDTVDCYLSSRLPNAKDATEKLEIVLTARDVGEWKDEVVDHPELDELEAQFRQEIEEQGLTPIPHVKKNYEKSPFRLKYQGEENPWGIMNVSLEAEMRRQRIEREEAQLLKEINNGEKEEKE